MTEITDQLSCQELVELVTDYLDDALPPAERVRFDAHIAGCDGCTGYLEQIRLTIASTGRLAPEPTHRCSPGEDAKGTCCGGREMKPVNRRRETGSSSGAIDGDRPARSRAARARG